MSQIPLPFGRQLRAGAPEVLTAGPKTYILHFIRERRARRYVLRVRPDGALRVTLPYWGSRAEARQFVRQHLPWADRERARQLAQHQPPREWREGTDVLLHGSAVRLRVEVTQGGRAVVFAADRVAIPADASDLRPYVEQYLRSRAAAELPVRLQVLAARHGLTPGRVTVRSQRSRWGSCSPSGAIGLNWRLVQMADRIRDYVLIHELMHLKQANHSRRFWRLVEQACPHFREAERWLKDHGPDLF